MLSAGEFHQCFYYSFGITGNLRQCGIKHVAGRGDYEIFTVNGHLTMPFVLMFTPEFCYIGCSASVISYCNSYITEDPGNEHRRDA